MNTTPGALIERIVKLEHLLDEIYEESKWADLKMYSEADWVNWAQDVNERIGELLKEKTDGNKTE